MSYSGFISISLMTIKIEYLICAWIIWITTSVNCLFKLFIYLFLECMLLLLIRKIGVIYAHMSPFSDI